MVAAGRLTGRAPKPCFAEDIDAAAPGPRSTWRGILNNTEYQGYDPVEAFSYCLWAMADAGDDAPVDFRQACAAVAEALSPGERATAQALADGL